MSDSRDATSDLGSKMNFDGEVCDIAKKRLDDSLLEFLPPPFKKQDVVFLHCDIEALTGNLVGGEYGDLSVNWCLGDKDIEVLKGTTGFVVEG